MAIDKKTLKSRAVLSKKIKRARNAIKKKYIAMKIGEKEAEEYSKRRYKPLIEEIGKIRHIPEKEDIRSKFSIRQSDPEIRMDYSDDSSTSYISLEGKSSGDEKFDSNKAVELVPRNSFSSEDELPLNQRIIELPSKRWKKKESEDDVVKKLKTVIEKREKKKNQKKKKQTPKKFIKDEPSTSKDFGKEIKREFESKNDDFKDITSPKIKNEMTEINFSSSDDDSIMSEIGDDRNNSNNYNWNIDKSFANTQKRNKRKQVNSENELENKKRVITNNNNSQKIEMEKNINDKFSNDSYDKSSDSEDNISVVKNKKKMTRGQRKIIESKKNMNEIIRQVHEAEANKSVKKDKVKPFPVVRLRKLKRENLKEKGFTKGDSIDKKRKIDANLIKKNKSGKGLLSVTKNKIDYIYFDDPNEIVERLLLLKSAELAGNSGLNNEIISIEEELKERDLIV